MRVPFTRVGTGEDVAGPASPWSPIVSVDRAGDVSSEGPHVPAGSGAAAGPAPGDLEAAEFRRLGYRAIDLIADYFGGLGSDDVFPGRSAAELEAVFDEPVPERGQDGDALLDAWEQRILPNATRVGSPRYFGFVMGSSTMMGVLAEALSASLNANTGVWKAAPSATEIERRSIAWLAELIGYDPTCGGLFVSGGTMANVSAVMTALRNTAPYDMAGDGLQSEARRGRFTLYMADHERHASFLRAVDMLGLGRDAIRLVPSDDCFRMDVRALETLITQDRDRGMIPFCVVGQAGSINVGAIDPLADIAATAHRHGLWFHVDGACGAFGAMLPEMRERFRGMEAADSITLDPHKWLAVPYACGCLLVRHPEHLRRAFSFSAPYLRGTLPTEHTGLDYYEYGPEMSRPFRALKVWMSLKHYGADGYRPLLRGTLDCARHAWDVVRTSTDFEPLHEPEIYICCFRYAPEALRPTAGLPDAEREATERRLDDLNQRIADALQASGFAFLMTTKVRGRVVLRLSICSHRTSRRDIDTVLRAARRTGAALLRAEGAASNLEP